MSKVRPVATIYRSASGRYVDWRAMVSRARQLPGVWWMAEANVSIHTVRRVNEQRHRDLQHLRGGELMAQARNIHKNEDGLRRCDLFLRWTPKEES